MDFERLRKICIGICGYGDLEVSDRLLLIELVNVAEAATMTVSAIGPDVPYPAIKHLCEQLERLAIVTETP